MAKVAPTIQLSDGNKMPVIAIGSWATKGTEVYEAVKAAIDVGYRHIDTAIIYQNEKDVGQAIREKIAEGKVTREEIYVTTKLAPTSHATDQVVPACKKSLENLGLDYIDCYLIHWPVSMKYSTFTGNMLENLVSDSVDYVDAWKGMEEVLRLGLARSIGISNFNSQQVERLLKNATVKPVVNQVECNIMLNQKKLRDFCKERDIVITSYCPLARPDPVKKTPAFFYSEEMAQIAKKYGKTPAKVTLRYLVSPKVKL